jgi:hypothetical protein
LLSWAESPGALSYTVERSLDGTAWGVITAGAVATSYTDSALAYGTTYYYRVYAVGPAGSSPVSAVVSIETATQPDILSAGAVTIDLTKGSKFDGPVASFTDAQTATLSGRFIATINWGDGTSSAGVVSGGVGSFSVAGVHRYGRLGTFRVEVSIRMIPPNPQTIRVASEAEVTTAKRRHVRAAQRVAPNRQKRKTRPAHGEVRKPGAH